ncbi:MAG: hypothetical protein L0207_04470 [Chlamydiae bacterium]|nr:hypothetical protein [Chlamydiota bacterium]
MTSRIFNGSLSLSGPITIDKFNAVNNSVSKLFVRVQQNNRIEQNKRSIFANAREPLHSPLVYQNLTKPVNHFYHTFSNGATLSNDLSTNRLFLGLLLLTALGIMEEIHTKDSSPEQVERINALLEKSPESRTIDENIELFNFLLKKGEEEAKKATNKNVVIVFGNTGAGKSTCLNFLYGCKMTVDDRKIVVDPKSAIKEVAKIGTEVNSCTSIPKMIPDISVKITDISSPAEDFVARQKECTLTFYDTPGLSDTRGIEVVLANAIVMKQIIDNANSVRFVMLFEHGQLNAERGQKWREAVKLTEERFTNTLGRGEKSLCLVITKEKDDIDTIKKDIKKYTQDNSVDLSKYATVYNPLDSNDRQKLLDLIFETRIYRRLNIKISMNDDQLWKASVLGDKIQEGVGADLEKGDKDRINEAVKKVQFTYGIAKLGNEGLTKPHVSATRAVQDYLKRIIDDIEPRTNPPLENQIEAFKKYESLRETFAPFVNFEQFEKDVRILIKETKDPRWIVWHKPTTSLTGGISTIVLTAGGFVFPPLWGGAAATGIVTIKAIWHWCKPSQKEKDQEAFFSKGS